MKKTLHTDTVNQPLRNVPMKQSLRYKILFVVLPLLILTVSFLGVTTYFSSNNGITGIAKEFVGYKLQEVYQVAQQQMMRISLLSVGEVDIRANVLEYSQKFKEETVIIIPVDGDFRNQSANFWASKPDITIDELGELFRIVDTLENIAIADPLKRNNWLNFRSVSGVSRVGVYIPYDEMKSYIVMLLPQEFFYTPVRNIMGYIIIILAVSIIVSIIVMLNFVSFITKPLQESVETIRTITQNIDLTRRIRVYYPDEIGYLGQYFNDMIAELEGAYNQVKNYAYQTVLAKRKEERIRFIFQKYVPRDVIDEVLNRSNDSLLIGNKQKVSILFSDIRGFTSISEQMKPDDLVISLNAYFNSMVEQILSRKGIIDKFIGDAIMAVYGAPKVRPDDADNALQSALGMVEALEIFNRMQREAGRVEFLTGIGINTGDAIVGNIGSEQKIDFTVIGDSVNLGSRLEGLTKEYHCPVLISNFTKEALIHPEHYYFIEVDRVRVKGKQEPVAIFCPYLRASLSADNLSCYTRYHEARAYYLTGEFLRAKNLFLELSRLYPNFYLADMYTQRCVVYCDNPPKDWDGVETWETK
ncbi:MAG: adenylate/guanylate cyclase domain-containing protein [Brevinema sp.]